MNVDLLNKFKNCRGVGFDLDGTIVDSKLDFFKMREDLGLSGSEPILESLETMSLEEKERALSIIDEHELNGAQCSELILGVRDLLYYLKERSVPVGLLTRNSQNVALLSLKKFDLDFDIVLSRDTARAKPDPHGLELMAQKWGIETNELAFFGDSSFDIKTAINANSLPVLYSPIKINHSETYGVDYRDQILELHCYKDFLKSL